VDEVGKSAFAVFFSLTESDVDNPCGKSGLSVTGGAVISPELIFVVFKEN